MRILFCGVAAIALSGCSWMHSHDNNAAYGQNSYGQNSGSVYTSNTSNTSSSGVTDAWGNPIGYGNQNTVQNQTGTYTTGGYGQNVGVASNGYNNTGYNNAPTYQQPQMRGPSKFGVFGSIGTDFAVGGTALAGNDAAFNPLGKANQVSMKDAFGRALRAEFGGTYKLGNSNEVSLSGNYQKASGNDLTLGQDNLGRAVLGKFSDYKGYGVEAGFKHNMGMTDIPLFNSVQPYVEARAGAMHIDDIGLSNLRIDGVAGPGVTSTLYKGGWVPTASGLVGFEKDISGKTSIGLETGLRYAGGLDADNSALVPFTTGTNTGGSRWSVPVQIRGRYRF